MKNFSYSTLKIGYVGAITAYKGFPLLKGILPQINGNYSLNVWGSIKGCDSDNNKIYYLGKFNSDSVANVYENMDVLIVPSVWKETFSLVTLEALSYGVPVIVSDNVGAKDIIAQYNPKFVYHNILELRLLLQDIIDNRKALENYNQKIMLGEWNYSINTHAEDIVKYFYCPLS